MAASDAPPSTAPAARLLHPPYSYVLIFLVALAFWGHTVRYEFVWDDRDFIERLESIRSLRNVPAMFLRLDAQSANPAELKVFRPLRTMVYAFLVFAGRTGRPKAWIFHLNNVLWHGLAAVLLCAVAGKLLRIGGQEDGERPMAERSVIPLIVGLGYVLHPVVSEVVCWAKGLDDIMAAVFTLAATLCLLSWPRRRGGYPLSLVFYILAVYSKVSAAPFFLFAPLLLWRRGTTWRRAAAASLPFAAATALFLLHRHGVMGQTRQAAPLSGTMAQTLVDMLPVAARYARLLMGVPPFFIDYIYMKGGNPLWAPGVAAGVILVLALLWGSGRALATRRGAGIGLGLAWTGLFLLPVSNLVPMMQYMAERFLYLPLAGWLLFLGDALQRKVVHRRMAAALGLGVLCLWTAGAWQRSRLWKDNLTLFVLSVQNGPKCRRVENNVVAAALALPHMRKALAPGVAGEVDSRDWERVFGTLDELQKLVPDNGGVYLAKGVAYARLGRRDEALENFRKAVELSPKDAMAWANLAAVHLGEGALEKARTELLRALARDAERVAVRRLLAEWYEKRGEPRNAARIYRWILRDFPGNAQALAMLERIAPGAASGERKDTGRASGEARHAHGGN
ncbi:MAG: tetratricopeptide repeat protein [Kiritimatiellaeota bacterium]|nr:tetratricopeptide repeat protein [Kiritimatiellota bacterium]